MYQVMVPHHRTHTVSFFQKPYLAPFLDLDNIYIYIHDFMPFLSPQRVCSRAAPERQSESKDTLLLHSEKIHREDFTHKRPYTERDLHRAAFTQTLLHTDAFTYRSFYTEKPFQKDLTTRSLYTEQLYTQTLFHKEAFTGTLTRRCPSFYTQELLHTRLKKRSF